ncbi:hypothetical protein M885DRAFT_553489 [Pelagophyceae sp. CCMP2097]|nr:hypothetical protein M885DRAFT_553489 [Pelagophyceae sp. CCMP2097]
MDRNGGKVMIACGALFAAMLGGLLPAVVVSAAADPALARAGADVMFVHVPGTGGSTFATALQRYGCVYGKRMSPVTNGVTRHGPEDARWDLSAYGVVASHLPGVATADAWRRARGVGAKVVTLLRDPVEHAFKHAHAHEAARFDAQYQYLIHGWRQNAGTVAPAYLSIAEASDFLAAHFDAVGVLGRRTAPGQISFYDDFVVRCSLLLAGTPTALLYYPVNVAASCRQPSRRPAKIRPAERTLTVRRPAERRPAERQRKGVAEQLSWGLPNNRLRPSPTAGEWQRYSEALADALCPRASARGGAGNASRAAAGPAATAPAACPELRRALLADDPFVAAGPAWHAAVAGARLPADVALVLAAYAGHATATAHSTWQGHATAFAARLAPYRALKEHLEGGGAACNTSVTAHDATSCSLLV